METSDRYEPYRLVDADGVTVEAVSVYFQELLAAGKAPSTVRSYGMDLLRWWRFLQAADVPWDRATRIEARDFSCWIQLTTKPRRGSTPKRRSVQNGTGPNLVTGKPTVGPGYAPTTVAHSETVLRRFYDIHRDAGTGPLLNPFPLDLSRRSGRAHAHHNPMDGWKPERVGAIGPAFRGGSRAPFPRSGSTNCSPPCPRIATGPWSRSGSPPGYGPRSCSASDSVTSTPASNWSAWCVRARGQSNRCRRLLTRSYGCACISRRYTARSRVVGRSRCGGHGDARFAR